MTIFAATIVGLAAMKWTLHVGAFCAGLIAAATWVRRLAAASPARQAPARPTAATPRAPIEAASNAICSLAERMAGDVHAHAEAVGAASDELKPLCQSPAEKSPSVREAAVKTVAANMKLQRRLEDAERRIRSHIGDLRAVR